MKKTSISRKFAGNRATLGERALGRSRKDQASPLKSVRIFLYNPAFMTRISPTIPLPLGGGSGISDFIPPKNSAVTIPWQEKSSQENHGCPRTHPAAAPSSPARIRERICRDRVPVAATSRVRPVGLSIVIRTSIRSRGRYSSTRSPHSTSAIPSTANNSSNPRSANSSAFRSRYVSQCRIGMRPGYS